ncbi:MAG: branched-chain amino acid transaminase [Verrucomicrobia bacterium]|nr:branched-chain amino acid transaminase [Verrucomicrobiota bacterium]
MPFAYCHGSVVPLSEAHVSIATNSLQYGTTCFAGIRGYVKEGVVRIFRLADHHERLMNGAKIMGFNYSISYPEFFAIIEELVRKNDPKETFYIRPFIFAADEQLGPRPPGLHFELAIYFVSLKQYFPLDKGMNLMISSWQKFSDSSFPTKAKAGGCYVHSFLATAEALRCGYDEALVMDHEGDVVEASVANLLMVYRDRLLMPALGTAQLEGITMRTVCELLHEEGLEIHFERIDRSMVYTCKELLLLGTAAQIAFASSVDDRPIGDGSPGPICQLARKKFQEVIDGTHRKSGEWMTLCSATATTN